MTAYGTLTARDHGAERRAILRMTDWARDQKFTRFGPLHWIIPNDGSWTSDTLAGIEVRRIGLDGELHLMGRRSWRDPQCVLCSLYRDPDGPRVVGLPDGTCSASRPERARRPLSRSLLTVPVLASGAAFMATAIGGSPQTTQIPPPVAAAFSPEPGPTPNRADQWAGSPVDDALHVTAEGNGMRVMPGGNGTGLGNAQLQDEAKLDAEAQSWVQQNVIGEDGADLDFFERLEGTADPSEGFAQPPAPGASQNFRDAYEAGQRAKAERAAEDERAMGGGTETEATTTPEDASSSAEEDPGTSGSTEPQVKVVEPPTEPAEEPAAVELPPAEPMPLPEPVEPPVPDIAADTVEPGVTDDAADTELTPVQLRERASHYRAAAEHLEAAADAIEAGDNVGSGDLDGQGGDSVTAGSDSVDVESDSETGTVDLDLGPLEITVNGEPQTVRIQLDGVEFDVEDDGATAAVTGEAQTTTA